MPESLPDRGVVYSVTGEKFLREAEYSARSLKLHMPNLPVALFTEKADISSDIFDITRIIESPTNSAFDKQFRFREILFEKTLFLDSDTYIARPFPEIFDLLDRFDMAATREFWTGLEGLRHPICYDVFNSGVLAFANRPAVRRLLDYWYGLAINDYNDSPKEYKDQGSFRKATYETMDLSIYVLAAQYNLRLPATNIINVWAQPVILHGRSSRLEVLAKQLSSTDDHRLLIPNLGGFGRLRIIFSSKPASILLGLSLHVVSFLIKTIRYPFRSSENSPSA